MGTTSRMLLGRLCRPSELPWGRRVIALSSTKDCCFPQLQCPMPQLVRESLSVPQQLLEQNREVHHTISRRLQSSSGGSPSDSSSSSSSSSQSQSQSQSQPPSSSSYYRFLYFDTRGAGETIRYLLAMTGAPFQDVRYPIKATAKGFGVDSTFLRDQELGMFQSNMDKLPILQVIQDNGSIAMSLGQSYTILRFLAHHHGAMGCNSLDAAYIDMIVECVRDIKTAWFKAKKQSKSSDFIQKDLPEWCRKLEAALPAPSSSSSSSSPWLVGEDKPSIADISVYALLATPTSIMTGSSQSFFDGAWAETIESAYLSKHTTLGSGCPRLTRSMQAMSQLESIRKWERHRPDTFN